MSNVKESDTNPVYGNCNDGILIINKVIEFLQFFMTVTLAKKTVAMLLLAAGLPVQRVTALTGLCDRSTRGLLKAMQQEDVAALLTRKSGSGQKRKTAGLEAEILAEISSNNYHTRQQIADMVKEKFNVQISASTVGRLLKKTALEG